MGMTCYTDWKFIRTGRRAYDKAKELLKYLINRDDRDHHIPRAGGPDRWVDCGLGGSWREIMDGVAELQSQKVLMRSLVLRPPQELIAQLEEVDPELWAGRRGLMSEVVERVMEAEMDRAGAEWPAGRQPLDLPYSYVIHAADDAQGIENLQPMSSWLRWIGIENSLSMSIPKIRNTRAKWLSGRRNDSSS